MNDNAPDPLPKTPPAGPKPQAAGRDDRLRAALLANMARRKAQARARADRNDNKPEADPIWTRS